MEYGLIGEHLSHSFSKKIHESLAEYRYDLYEIQPYDLKSFFEKKEFKAINVTIPYKEKVIPFLDEISKQAKEIGAVNVVVNKNGKLIGHNTDYDGFELLSQHAKINFENKNVLILGSGGASKACKAVIKNHNVKNILRASRKNKVDCISYDEIKKHQEIEIIVNTTPVGMYPDNEKSLVDLDCFPNLEGYLDVIYNPINTIQALKAKEKGIKSEGGLYMLVAQAIKSIEIFLGKRIDETLIKHLYKKTLQENSNIVLIGMPSSGKTSIGKQLASKLNIQFSDTDDLIMKKYKLTPNEIIISKGEKYFREIESEIIRDIFKTTPQVISTGGGIVLKEENINLLKQNGRIYFINRNIDSLFPSEDRPLSRNRNDLIKLYNERIKLYNKFCDIVIDNNLDIEYAINQILEDRK